MSYIPRVKKILEDDRFTAKQNVEIAIKYIKGIIQEIEQKKQDFKKAEQHETTKDFYKYHLFELIRTLLGEKQV